ncbi:MAG: hypothetical protein ACYSR0_12680, partial [Planctomycetota bacterium]
EINELTHVPSLVHHNIYYFSLTKNAPLKPFPHNLFTPILFDIIENYIESEFEADIYYVSGWIKGTLRIREM